jgi:hypothetical protein
MSISFTLGAQAFGVLSDSSDGRQAINLWVGPPVQALRRYHPRGAAGNITSRDGRGGQKIVAIGRYVGSLSTVLGYLKTDLEAWAAASISIIDGASNTYTRCNLEPDGAQLQEIKAFATSKVHALLTFTFNRDS